MTSSVTTVSEGILRVSGHTDNLLGKIDQMLENKHPAWLDDIIIVTKSLKEQHKKS